MKGTAANLEGGLSLFGFLVNEQCLDWRNNLNSMCHINKKKKANVKCCCRRNSVL